MRLAASAGSSPPRKWKGWYAATSPEKHMTAIAHIPPAGEAIQVGLTRVPVQEFDQLPGSRTGSSRGMAGDLLMIMCSRRSPNPSTAIAVKPKVFPELPQGVPGRPEHLPGMHVRHEFLQFFFRHHLAVEQMHFLLGMFGKARIVGDHIKSSRALRCRF